MPAYYIQRALLHSIFIVPVFIILFIVFGLYSSLWEFAGSREVLKIAAACISGSAIVTFIDSTVCSFNSMSGPYTAGWRYPYVIQDSQEDL